MSNELYVVLGASGGLGSAVVRLLSRMGKTVRAVSRGGKAEVLDGVIPYAADLMDRDETFTACEGATTVFNCSNAAYNKWPELLPTMTENSLKATAATGARFVFGDNLYMYGYVDGPITENSPRAATGSKGKVRIQLEEMVMDAHENGNVQVAIGRASDFYGPMSFAGSGSLMFVPALTGKKAQALGNIDQPHTWSFTEDFARGLIKLSQEDSAFGDVWHIPSAETITTRQLIELIYSEANQEKAKVMTAGSFMISLMGLFDPIIRELKEMMYEWNYPYIVDHSKYEKAFGKDVTSHQEAVKYTLGWFKKYLETNK